MEVRVALGVLPGVRMDRTTARLEVRAVLVLLPEIHGSAGTLMEVLVALEVLPGVRMDRTAARLEVRALLVVLLGVQSPSLKREKI